MTIEEYFERQREIFSEPGGEAKIYPGGGIVVRAPNEAHQGFVDSPISAVAHVLKPEATHWLCTASERAGKEIGLTAEDTEEIDKASWNLPGHNPDLRRRHFETLPIPRATTTA